MKESPHIMPIAVQDYRTSRVRLRSVTSSDPTLRALYLELLFALWERGGRIPADPDSVADEVGLPAADVAPRLAILAKLGESGRGGIVIEDGWIKNARVSEDLEHALAYRERQSYRGRRSGAVRRERGLSAGSASAEPSSSVPVSDHSPTPETVTVPRVERTGPRKKLDLLAYADALSELWPLQPMPDRLGVEQELFSQTDRLPDFETFRDNCAEWFRSDSWRDREPKYIGSPVSFLRKGTHEKPPGKPRASVKAGPTLDEGRRTVEADIANAYRAKRVTEDERDALIERMRAATSADELRAIAEEVARGRVA